eukprot:scaffold719_cov145-Skeletonema_menzelii.AAC.3
MYVAGSCSSLSIAQSRYLGLHTTTDKVVNNDFNQASDSYYSYCCLATSRGLLLHFFNVIINTWTAVTDTNKSTVVTIFVSIVPTTHFK